MSDLFCYRFGKQKINENRGEIFKKGFLAKFLRFLYWLILAFYFAV